MSELYIDSILAKINLHHNFDDILAILEDYCELDDSVVSLFRSRTAPYLGFEESLGFAFHLVSDAKDVTLPYTADQIVKSDQVVDWFTLQLNVFMEKFTLNIDEDDLSEELEDYICESLRKYRLRDGYEHKLEVNHNYIMDLFREYKALISDMIRKLDN